MFAFGAIPAGRCGQARFTATAAGWRSGARFVVACPRLPQPIVYWLQGGLRASCSTRQFRTSERAVPPFFGLRGQRCGVMPVFGTSVIKHLWETWFAPLLAYAKFRLEFPLNFHSELQEFASCAQISRQMG